MDCILKLPKSNSFDAIMVVGDSLSKYWHFIPLKHPYSTGLVAKIFMKEVLRLHGIPTAIVNDRDPMLMSVFWSEMCKLQGTVLKVSTLNQMVKSRYLIGFWRPVFAISIQNSQKDG